MMMRHLPTICLLLTSSWLLLACDDPKEANQPPAFDALSIEEEVSVGDFVQFTVSATDPDGDTVKLTMEQGPPGAEFSAPGELGRFYWAPLASDTEGGGRSHDVIFAASDGRGGHTTARVVIRVTPSAGPPQFITSPQRILDLTRTDTLMADIAVKDDDSTRVTFSLESAPKGMEIYEAGPKRAEVHWTPDEEQIAQRPLWTARIIADDGTSEPAVQELLITLIAKKDCSLPDASCGCQPPELSHQELPDQREPGDYSVQATITDGQSAVQSATLYWTREDPSNRSNFNAVPMEASGARYSASIPNPQLAPGQNAPIYYFLCATDDDDPAGQRCDSSGCLPQEGIFSFTAFAQGDQDTCREDEAEPNNVAAQATALDEGRRQGLTLCPEDVDLYRVPLGIGQSLTVLVSYTASNGALLARALGPEGQEIARDDTPQDDAILTVAASDRPTEVYLEITGEPNTYDLILDLDFDSGEDGCQDIFEPNNTLEEATRVEDLPLEASNLRVCQGEADIYALELSEGDKLTAWARFVHSAGDIDISLRDAEGATVARSDSLTDDESLSEVQIRADGTYYLYVTLYQGQSQSYDLELSVEGSQPMVCQDDSFEPNNSIEEASPFSVGRYPGLQLCAGQEDYYAVFVERGVQITSEIRFTHSASADLDLELLGPMEGEVLATSNSTSDNERVQATAQQSGVHVLRVQGYQGSQAPYSMVLSVCQNDAQDPNDSPEDATPLISGTLTDLVICPQEEDWFRVSLRSGELLGIDLRASNLEDLEMILYASNGERVLQEAQQDSGGLFFSYVAGANQEVLVRIRSTSQSSSPLLYDLLTQIIF